MTLPGGQRDRSGRGSAGVPGRHEDRLSRGGPRPGGVRFRLRQGDTPRSGAEAGFVILGCIGLVLVVVLLAILVPAMTRKPDGGWELKSAVVESKSWVRAVELEERRIVVREGWELPDSAELVSRSREVREHDRVVDGYRPVTRRVARTERVPDGTETRSREVRERVRTGTRTYVCGQRDLGNGYFEEVKCTEPVYETRTRTETWEEPKYREETRYEMVTEQEPVYRSVPVYDTLYTFRVPEWVHARKLRAQGDTTQPTWPEVEVRPGEREARRTEHYYVVFREAGGRKRPAQLFLGEWRRYRVGQRVALRVTTTRDTIEVRVLPADSLRECRRWHAGGGKPPPDSLGCSPRAGNR